MNYKQSLKLLTAIHIICFESMLDCTWRGKVYCDGDTVIVRIFMLINTYFFKISF